MKASCIPNPPQERLVLIHQWQVEYCEGNHCAAALLQFFTYWHDIKLNMQGKNQQANRIAESHGEAGAQDESLLQFHTREELKAGLLNLYSDSAIKKGKDFLIAKGAISKHRNPNPKYTYDNTTYFLLHPANLLNFLNQRKTTGPGDENNGLSGETTRTVHAKTTDSLHKNNGTITETATETPTESTKKEVTDNCLQSPVDSCPVTGDGVSHLSKGNKGRGTEEGKAWSRRNGGIVEVLADGGNACAAADQTPQPWKRTPTPISKTPILMAPPLASPPRQDAHLITTLNPGPPVSFEQSTHPAAKPYIHPALRADHEPARYVPGALMQGVLHCMAHKDAPQTEVEGVMHDWGRDKTIDMEARDEIYVRKAQPMQLTLHPRAARRSTHTPHREGVAMKEVLMIADETTREAKEGNSQAGVGEPTAATHISPPTHPTLELHTPEVLPIPPTLPQGKPPSPIPPTTEATHIGSVLGSFMEGLSNAEGDVRGRGTEGGITPLISPSGKNCLT